MFRDTSAQDRSVATASGLRRYAPWLAAAATVLGLLVLAGPAAQRALSAEASVARSRLGIAKVQRGDFVRDIAADGRVVAAVSPTLYAPAAGTVALKVQAGDRVAKDAVIAVIDSPELTSQLAQEQARLASLAIDYQRAQLQARREQMTAQEAVDRAQVDRNTAAREVDRSRQAFQQGAYAELQVLRNEDALEKADFALARARADLELEPEAIRFDIESRRLARDQQKLLVDDLARRVSALALRSPVSGQVGQLLIADRASVARDAPLITVVDLSQLELEIKVPESFARELQTGMPAEITGGGEALGTGSGLVSAVSPEVVGGQVAARVRFAEGTPEGLRQNQRLAVRVLLDERKDVLMVARGSFVDQNGGRFVYVIRNGIAERRAVQLGASSIREVEIREGLDVGDEVVVSGSDIFDDAERVIVAE